VAPLTAQQTAAHKPAVEAAPTNQDIEALKRQIQALTGRQIAVQKQLDGIKAMVKAGSQAPAGAPAPPPKSRWLIR
jgi:hypothetical protein